jgi:Ca-activated chloride channel family protein
MLERSEASNRVVMLLTDGNDTGSTVAPLQAARIAAARGITIHVVGVGDPTAAGEDPLNEDVLRTIAARTEGLYFKAEDRPQLEAVYRELDAREAIEFESTTFVPRRTVFHWPLGIAVLLMLGLVVLQITPARVRGALGAGDA